MESRTPFDHSDHLRRLEEASNLLAGMGRDDLAGAARRAMKLHTELMSRIHEIRQVQLKLRRIAGRLTIIDQDLGARVTKNEAPWIIPANTLFDEG